MPLLAQVVMAHANGLPEDAFVNHFALRTAPAFTAADAALAGVDVAGFYNLVPIGQSAAPGDYLSAEVSRAALAHQVKVYDISTHLDGSPHGSPIAVHTWTLARPAPPAAEGLPAEMAVAVTLEAVGRDDAPVEAPDGTDPGLELDRPKSRFTGRFYFGPCSQALRIAAPTTNIIRVNGVGAAVLRSGVKDLNNRLPISTSSAVLGVGVWSRSDVQMRALAKISTDDAWDVQRRRGPRPSGRTPTTA